MRLEIRCQRIDSLCFNHCSLGFAIVDIDREVTVGAIATRSQIVLQDRNLLAILQQ